MGSYTKVLTDSGTTGSIRGVETVIFRSPRARLHKAQALDVKVLGLALSTLTIPIC